MDSSNVEEIITCGICLETFNEDSRCPRILNCGHSFCHSCLEKLIEQSPCCPTCKKRFRFKKASSIAINFSLKSLLNIRSEVISSTISSVKALAVEEAYFEQKKQLAIKVEAELGERKATFERLDESLRILEEEKKCLIEEIKEKEQELKDREKRIRDLESLKSDGRKFCQKLERLHGLVESSSIGSELSKAISELEKLIEEHKTEIPDGLYQLHQPLLIKQLENWCTTGSVYVQEDDFDRTKYGKVTVKDGRILVHNFRPEKPKACLIQFKDLLSKFTASSELPNTAFLRLTPRDGGNEVDVLIQTDGTSPRAKNFLLLCSGLKGPTYILSTMECVNSFCCYLKSHPAAVVEGIRYDDARVTLKKAGVYGMEDGNSWFQIQLRDEPSQSFHEIGSVVAGLQGLIRRKGIRNFSIFDCGLVI